MPIESRIGKNVILAFESRFLALSFFLSMSGIGGASARALFTTAATMRFGLNLFFPRSAPSGVPSYWPIMLLTTIVWDSKNAN
ncbi:MAG TPA: hypothetical protein VJP02_02180 [Candidatus Sulfotelmatobacter sp.]|nr:hypothetical protein [Candidatus Sulfotelmatobacter sp.]